MWRLHHCDTITPEEKCHEYFCRESPVTTTEEELACSFTPMGHQPRPIVQDEATGYSRGFGFVEMPTRARPSRHDGLQGTTLGDGIDWSRRRTTGRAEGPRRLRGRPPRGCALTDRSDIKWR